MAETPPTWLNSEFLEKALRSNGKNPDVTVTSCEIKRAALAGDHYGSEMYRATLKTQDNGKTEEISLIVKCKLRGGELSKIADDFDIFIKEARTFTDLHIPMSNLLKDALGGNFKPIAAKCIYTNIEPDAIILEDLKSIGYRLASVTHGLDLKHCLLVMKKIAYYHASSLVLLQQDPKVFEMFMDNFFSKNNHTGMSAFFSSTIKTLKEHVRKWPGYERYERTLVALENTVMDRWTGAIRRDETGFNVLIHGDLWLNNMMFQYSQENDHVQDVRLVDFQLSYVTSPAIDLMYFMNSSASPEVLEHNRLFLIDEYYNALCQTLTRLGHKDLQPTKDCLQAELKKKEVFGILAAFTIRAFALADRNHVPDVEGIMKQNSTLHYSSCFQEAIKKLLPLYEKWGWLKL